MSYGPGRIVTSKRVNSPPQSIAIVSATDRLATAAAARAATLGRFLTRPAVDPLIVAKQIASAAAKARRAVAKKAAKVAAEAAAKAAAAAQKAEAERLAAEAEAAQAALMAEQKRRRDERYARRQARRRKGN